MQYHSDMVWYSCNKSFQDHNLSLATDVDMPTIIDTDEITTTYIGGDKVEVGIQACTYRKPGRKPKTLKVEEKKEEPKQQVEEEEEIMEKDMILESRRWAFLSSELYILLLPFG